MLHYIFESITNNLPLYIAICVALTLIEIVILISQREKPMSEKAITIISILVTFLLGIGGFAFSINKDTPHNNAGSATLTPSDQEKQEEVRSSSGTTSQEAVAKSEEEIVEFGAPFVVVSPDNQITNASLEKWDKENDRDIFENTYSSALKLSVFNLVDAIGGGQSSIIAEVHIPFGGKAIGTWTTSFVVAKDMVGNGSSADITILSGDTALFPTFTIDSTTTDEIKYEIELNDIRDLIFCFECTAIDSGFRIGIILEDI